MIMAIGTTSENKDIVTTHSTFAVISLLPIQTNLHHVIMHMPYLIIPFFCPFSFKSNHTKPVICTHTMRIYVSNYDLFLAKGLWYQSGSPLFQIVVAGDRIVIRPTKFRTRYL